MELAAEPLFLMREEERLHRVLRRIDRINSEDPHKLVVDGVAWPKELIHGRLVYAWATLLCPDPTESLQLAARAHHIARWRVPRHAFDAGPSGYHRWRAACQDYHARRIAEILEIEEFSAETALRVRELVLDHATLNGMHPFVDK